MYTADNAREDLAQFELGNTLNKGQIIDAIRKAVSRGADALGIGVPVNQEMINDLRNNHGFTIEGAEGDQPGIVISWSTAPTEEEVEEAIK